MKVTYIKDTYLGLIELRTILSQKKLSTHNVGNSVLFDECMSVIKTYNKLLDYIINDIDKPELIDLPITHHPHLKVVLNDFWVGSIMPKSNIVNPPMDTLTRLQTGELRVVAHKLANLAANLIISPKLIDYVGTRNKFDYESIKVLVETTLNYITYLDDLLTYNIGE